METENGPSKQLLYNSNFHIQYTTHQSLFLPIYSSELFASFGTHFGGSTPNRNNQQPSKSLKTINSHRLLFQLRFENSSEKMYISALPLSAPHRCKKRFCGFYFFLKKEHVLKCFLKVPCVLKSFFYLIASISTSKGVCSNKLVISVSGRW